MSILVMDKPYATKVVSDYNSLSLTNTKLVAGRTYYVKVAFRTRGDGDSTPSKCSSVGFIAYWDSWKQSRPYIHNSAQAYAERGALVSWTYSFTVASDVQPTVTALYFIINNGWANGYDNQTIDLYYAKYWDSAGNVYNEWGVDCENLNIRQGGKTYQPVVASTDKYTTPSLCFRRNGRTFYIPLAPKPVSGVETEACTIIDGSNKYQIAFSVYSSPKMYVRCNGQTYAIPNKSYINEVGIPAGTYSARSFEAIVQSFITLEGSRLVRKSYSVTVNGATRSFSANTPIAYTAKCSGCPRAVVFGSAAPSATIHPLSSFSANAMYAVPSSGSNNEYTSITLNVDGGTLTFA